MKLTVKYSKFFWRSTTLSNLKKWCFPINWYYSLFFHPSSLFPCKSKFHLLNLVKRR